MAESDQISRKRMRLSSSSVNHVNGQNHIHNNRPSRILSAASRAVNRFPGEKIEVKVPSRAYPRITIKDLRLRRVFSPASISSEWDFHGKGENLTKEQDKKSLGDSQNPYVAKEANNEDVPGLGDSKKDQETQTTPPDTELISREIVLTQETNGSLGNGFSEKKIDTNLRSKSVFHPCSRAKIFKNPGSFSYRRLLPYLTQAADDATSSVRCSKPNKEFDQVHLDISSQGNLGNGKTRNGITQDQKEAVGALVTIKDQSGETKDDLQSADGIFNKASVGSSRGNTSPLKKVSESSLNRKSVCSKRKLFRTPGSVNYRRLLPYLSDIPEGLPDIGNHTDIEKKAEENVLSTSPVSENEGAQGMVTSDATRYTRRSVDRGTQPLEHVSESAELSDPHKEQETQVKHVILDTEKNLDTPCEVLGSEILQSPHPDCRFSSDVATSVLNDTPVDTLVEAENADTEMGNGAEELEAGKNAEKPDANGLNSKALLLDASTVPFETPPSTSPSKGILKRNLRGCRGLCDCLNCSSFRLHAERAFEFSRNQMQDTEEMVLDLVGEISYLRDMLEKQGSADDAGSCTDQVREACKRASEATEVAKSRLHQMNDDLQVHCRIPASERT